MVCGRISPGQRPVSPAAFHAAVSPGQTDTQMGFCADRASGSTVLPALVSVSASF